MRSVMYQQTKPAMAGTALVKPLSTSNMRQHSIATTEPDRHIRVGFRVLDLLVISETILPAIHLVQKSSQSSQPITWLVLVNKIKQ